MYEAPVGFELSIISLTSSCTTFLCSRHPAPLLVLNMHFFQAVCGSRLCLSSGEQAPGSLPVPHLRMFLPSKALLCHTVYNFIPFLPNFVLFPISLYYYILPTREKAAWDIKCGPFCYHCCTRTVLDMPWVLNAYLFTRQTREIMSMVCLAIFDISLNNLVKTRTQICLYLLISSLMCRKSIKNYHSTFYMISCF